MALKRYVNGADGDFSSRSERPNHDPNGRTVELTFPPVETARDRHRRRGRGCGANLGAWTSTRTPSAPTTSITRTSCGSIWTRCRACPGTTSGEWRLVCREVLADFELGLAQDFRLARHPRQRRIERRWSFDEVRRAPRAGARSRAARPQSATSSGGGRRHGVSSTTRTQDRRRICLPGRPCPTPASRRRWHGTSCRIASWATSRSRRAWAVARSATRRPNRRSSRIAGALLERPQAGEAAW